MWTAIKNPLNILSNEHQRELFETENIAELQKRMNEANKNGWYPIHEAAYKGYVNAVRRFVEHSKDRLVQLEIETKDDLQATPILLAALGSNLDVVQCLYELGARIDAKNAHEHGIVEIASMRQDIEMLEFLISTPETGINVWRRLMQIFSIDSEDISGSVGRTLERLTEVPFEKTDERRVNIWRRNFKCLIENNLINVLCKVFQQRNRETLISAFFVTLNLIEYVENDNLYDLPKQFVKVGGLQILFSFLKMESSGQMSFDLDLVCLCGKVFDRLSRTNEMFSSSFAIANELTQSIYQSILKMLQKIRNPIVLFSFLDFITNLIKFGKTANIQLANLPMLATSLMPLFRECNDDFHLFRSLLRLTVALSHDSNELQSQFIKEGLATYLGIAVKSGSLELKELAISCIEVLSKTNVYVQKVLVKDGILQTLLTLLQKSQSHQQKVLTTNALWALAGDDPVQRKYMAIKIRVPVLVDFLSMKSDDLYFIACDALRVLFLQPPNVNSSIHDQFLDLHGVNALVRVLTNEKEYIVLGVIRCIQRLTVRAGLNAFKPAQIEVKKYNGITFLVALLLHCKQEIICAEAALALAHLCLDNSQNMEITAETLDFSYSYIYKLSKSKTPAIQLLATSALAMFAFNNIPQQRAMANIGTIPFSQFEKHFKSKDDAEKCEAAFQLIVLANLVVDTQQAISSARGIQILIDLLNNTITNVKVKISAAEKVACLGKLKNGVSDAIVAIDGIRVLCDNCYTDNENLQGTCAIALSHYSHLNEGRRKLLYKCRHDPELVDVLRFYNEYHGSKHYLSNHFNEEWQHYRNVGLPPSKENKKRNASNMKAKIAADSTPVIKSVTFNDTNGVDLEDENKMETVEENGENNENTEQGEDNVDLQNFNNDDADNIKAEIIIEE